MPQMFRFPARSGFMLTAPMLWSMTLRRVGLVIFVEVRLRFDGE